jgi:hypothetical protein
MNDDLEDIGSWRRAIEFRVTTLEATSDKHVGDISDHKGLLTVMDKDVSDAQTAFRAQLAVLNSVRETQSEQTRMLREHGIMLQEHSGALAELRAGLTEARVGIQTIIGLLTPADDNDKPDGESPS